MKLFLIQNYIQTIYRLFTNPRDFFSQLPENPHYTGPLTFALVTHWIGTSIGYLWALVFGNHIYLTLHEWMNKSGFYEMNSEWWMQKGQAWIKAWMMSAGSVIIDPFTTLFKIVIASAVIFMGARVFITPDSTGKPQVDFPSALQIICYGMAPSLLLAIPFAGSFFSDLGSFIVTLIGVKTIYRAETSRALVITLFPQFIALFLILIFSFMIFFALAQFVALQSF
ncbi:MAG: hypothetical protein CL678_17955 [Bdellovibrionaceae bacterium]|nr:hypothetical protein [Pseudobdellovibrionaceae bacterium]|tara:strand:+ start:2201 stop:2875 length:675 start_codon:yes stop_codon:yes gene_type:complete